MNIQGLQKMVQHFQMPGAFWELQLPDELPGKLAQKLKAR